MKTLGFLILTASLPFAFSYLKENNKDFRKGVALYNAESEVSTGIYTGKIRDVYDPLDESYKVTSKLTEMSKQASIPEQINDMPVVNLYVDPLDLEGKDRGIFSHGQKKGRLWERASYVEIFDNSNQIYADFVGVRIHGGSSRLPSVKLKSFRLYARKKYGSHPFDLGFDLNLGEQFPIRRLVVRRDTHLHFANEISFFIINQLSGIAPKSKQVSFYLNNEFIGFHLLHEHLSEEQLAGYFGHKDFLVAKLKGDKSLQARLQYIDLRTRMEHSESMSYDYVASKVDMDSVMSSLITIMYTGMTDWAQGTFIKDLKNKGLWRLISWDFDRAFHPVKGQSFDGELENNFEMKSIALGMDMKKGTIRWSIFNRLIHTDKKFRRYFSSLTDKLFDEVLAGEKFQNLILSLEKRSHGGEKTRKMRSDLVTIKSFIRSRKEVFCQDLLKHVNLVPKTCDKISGQNHKP